MSRVEEINFVNLVQKLSLNMIGHADTADMQIYHFMHRSCLSNICSIVTPVHLVKATGLMVNPSDNKV
jgi:hypothetical protein